MSKRTRDVHTDRLLLGEAGVISVEEAVRRLPMADGDARAFLRDADLIRRPDGKHTMVVWGEVVALVRGEPPAATRDRRRADLAPDLVPPAGRVRL